MTNLRYELLEIERNITSKQRNQPNKTKQQKHTQTLDTNHLEWNKKVGRETLWHCCDPGTSPSFQISSFNTEISEQHSLPKNQAKSLQCTPVVAGCPSSHCKLPPSSAFSAHSPSHTTRGSSFAVCLSPGSPRKAPRAVQRQFPPSWPASHSSTKSTA